MTSRSQAVPIDQGKTLLIKLVAVSPVNAVTGMREVLFEVRTPLLFLSYLSTMPDVRAGG